MSIEQKRAALKKRYPGWNKVDTMPDKQVHATYMRLLSAGSL